MTVERIAEFLATIGFEESSTKSIEKVLSNAQKQIGKLKVDPSAFGGQALKASSAQLQRYMQDLRATQKQAVELGKPLAPTQIFQGLEKIKNVEAKLKSSTPEAMKLKKELQGIKNLLNDQLTTKKNIEITTSADKAVRDLRQTLTTGTKDVGESLSREFQKTIASRSENLAQSVSLVQKKVQSGELTRREGESAIGQLNKQFELSQRSLASFASRVKTQSTSIKSDLDKVGIAVANNSKEMIKAEAKVSAAQKSGDQSRLTVATRNLNTLQAKHRAFNKERSRLEASYTQTVQTQTALQRKLMQVSLKKAQDSYQTFFQKIKKGVTSTRNVMTSVVAPAAAGLGIFRIGESNRQLNSISIALKTGAGNIKDYTQSMAFLRQQTARLGLDFVSVAPQFTKIVTSGRLMGLSLDQSKEAFLGIAEAATAMQLSSDDTQGAIRALTQMLSKGTVQAEELRGQLGERIPAAFPLAAKAMGVTTRELGKMLEQGQVLSNEFVPKFAKQLREFAAPGLEEAMNSFNAELGLTSTAITKFFGVIGKAGLVDIFRTSMQSLRLVMSGFAPVLGTLFSAVKIVTTPFRALIQLMSDAERESLQGDKTSGMLDTIFKLMAAGGITAFLIKATPLLRWIRALGVALLGVSVAGTPLIALWGKITGLILLAGSLMAAFAEVFELSRSSGRKTIFHDLEEQAGRVGIIINKAVVKPIARVLAMLQMVFTNIIESFHNLGKAITGDGSIVDAVIGIFNPLQKLSGVAQVGKNAASDIGNFDPLGEGSLLEETRKISANKSFTDFWKERGSNQGPASVTNNNSITLQQANTFDPSIKSPEEIGSVLGISTSKEVAKGLSQTGGTR